MFGLERQVAIYVRTLASVERNITNASLLGKLLSQEDRLGLTPAGLARNLWIIGAEDRAARTDNGQPAPRRAPASGRAKSRLEVLDGGA